MRSNSLVVVVLVALVLGVIVGLVFDAADLWKPGLAGLLTFVVVLLLGVLQGRNRPVV